MEELVENYKAYIHIFPNKKVYVGITKQKPEKRWAKGKGYKNNEYLLNAIKKYGWENIEHKVLYSGLSKEQAEEKEIELIKQYKSNKRKYGYNIQNGGNHVGSLGEETKRKISEMSKLFWKNQDYREKQRVSHIGKYPDNTGRKHTPDELRKMRENYHYHTSNKGKHLSEETKEKIRQANLGKKLSPQHKERLYQGSLKAGKNRQKAILCVETGKIYESIKDASVKNNIHHSNIIKVLKGDRKTSGGYSWVYVE